MRKVIARLLPLLLLVLFQPDSAGAQQPGHPPSLNLGDAVVTGFSGTLATDAAKPHPANKSAIDLTFINPDGPSARVINIGQPGYVWDGRVLAAPKTFDVLAKDVGQVFGVALDDQTPPNIYVAATSMFGLNIVSRGRDGSPERRKKGGPGAGWMKGQFGLDLQGGPGGIYKIDGRTGAVSLFANVTLDGVPNPGPGFGNLAYDSAHKQLFVSDLYTGMIHRFDLDGNELGRYDHGVTGLGAAKLATVPFDPKNRPNIASERFDSEKPDTWGFAPAARRVWGLAVHEGRLYYSVVGRTADLVGRHRARRQLRRRSALGARRPGAGGSVAGFRYRLLATGRDDRWRSARLIAGAYDYSAFTQPGEPQVLRVLAERPERSAVARPLEAGAGGICRRLRRQLPQHQWRRRARLRLWPATERSAPRLARPRCGPPGKISAMIRRCAANSNPAARWWFTGCKAARRIWCAMPTRRRRPAISSTMTTRSTIRARAATSAACASTQRPARRRPTSARSQPIRPVAAAVVVVGGLRLPATASPGHRPWPVRLSKRYCARG